MNVSAPIASCPDMAILTEAHSRALGWISTPLILRNLHRREKKRVGGRTPRSIWVNQSSHGLHLLVTLRRQYVAVMSRRNCPLQQSGDTQTQAY